MNKENTLSGAPLTVLLQQYHDNIFPTELLKTGLMF